MFVREMLPEASRRLATVGTNATLGDVAQELSSKNLGLVAVCERDGRMVGVVTDADIIRNVASCRGQECACTNEVQTVMSRDPASCHLDDRLQDAWSFMGDHGLRHLPIVDGDGKPVGILYARDALRNLFEEVREEEDLLRDYFMNFGARPSPNPD